MSATAARAAVVARDLTVVRGGRAVLTGLDLSVPSGRVVGLLGPSGCGKTTLMRAIVGVQVLAGGEVEVLGHPAGSAQLRTRVAYLTQAPSVYADLTVAENLRFFGRVLGTPQPGIDEVLDGLELAPFADRPVGRLSGGQRARVSLATALLGDPELCVLDEPTVGQDPVLRRELWNRFHDLARSGTTLLVSSHVMDEAERCDELLLMRDGRMIATGPPAALLERTGQADVESAFLQLVEGTEAT